MCREKVVAHLPTENQIWENNGSKIIDFYTGSIPYDKYESTDLSFQALW